MYLSRIRGTTRSARTLLLSFGENLQTMGSSTFPESHMDSGSVNEQSSTDERYLTQLWCSQLSLAAIGPADDFFEAGGSSMQVIEMLMTVANKFGKEVDYAEFFKEPCIRKLGELLAG
jgi:fengycin family lipopeptide synthetase D